MNPVWRQRLRDAGVLGGVAVQLLLVFLGVDFAVEFDEDEPDTMIFAWCLVATVYAAVMIISLSFAARTSAAAKEYRPSKLQANAVVRVTALTSSLVAGLMGVSAAFLVVVLRDDPTDGWWYKGLGVWAMVLAWGVVHWGFAQWYFARYYATANPPMEFPGTATPHLVDFVYFSYTVGTTFAASDVSVLSRDVRWRVTLHGVVAFFFNSAIVVLALSTLTGS
ncbi:DUF1345 domain-containing protein [Propionicimonas sp.]|uniref:DUF1345 domain-containing protein n=1 Tax=Propionicimonas sp. TaxID=1955623 RepID=UPI0017C45AC1|nr:DUF1345 domain-containing protein [Propionicimonas sp.]MBU3976866.1 DUF1345 domain-containing protein [Actinomycetota bacterium]MBA3019555.1 DUF1345 domain-containing protein [Propionicimonas sp.]MBU3986961.1 DUF1345 domain-containing protein [Actinomycetota bacterium]MBU4006873.1 DUF1345 domain-containing protein [Actinomycetota bacterium]MBU4065573.1 DUF1345 domain-containing protein [Actinomycetota bacterium]